MSEEGIKTADWEQLFIFGRGVEISKAGKAFNS